MVIGDIKMKKFLLLTLFLFSSLVKAQLAPADAQYFDTNYFTNPSFEQGKANWGFTAGSGTFTVTKTASEINNLKSAGKLVSSAQTINGSVCGTPPQGANKLYEASVNIRINGVTNLRTCVTVNGTEVACTEVLPNNNVYEPVKIPFYSTGGQITCLKFVSSGSATGTTYYSNAKLKEGISTLNSMTPDTGFIPCTFSSLAWQGLGTVTNLLECKKIGDVLKIRGHFVAGTTTANIAEIPFPNNWGSIQASLTVVDGTSYGTFYRGVTGANTLFTARVVTTGTNVIRIAGPLVSTTANPTSAVNGNTFLATGEFGMVSGELTIPIRGWLPNLNAFTSTLNQISSDTCTFVFQATALTGAEAPCTYNTYLKPANNQTTSTLNASAPTQTSASMNANGILVTARNYATAGTTTDPTRFDIFIGKFLKSVNVFGFDAVAKGGNELNLNPFVYSSTDQYGLHVTYNATTGILTIDAGGLVSNGITTRAFLRKTFASNSTTGYFSFYASNVPYQASLAQLGNSFYSGLGVDKYEEKFRIAFGNTSFMDACTNTTVCPYLRSKGGATVKYTGITGRYTVTFPKTYAQIYCMGIGEAGTARTYMTAEGGYAENTNTITLFFRNPTTGAVTNTGGIVDCGAFL